MTKLNNTAGKLKQLFACFALCIILLTGIHGFAQKRGEKTTVSKSAIVDFKTIEAFSKMHPVDPSQRRIGANVFEKGEEEENEKTPKLKIPKGAKILLDPFGKMPVAVAGKPLPGANAPASFSPIIDFNGIDDINSTIPPDVGGQVGPNHVITALNSFIRISTKTGAVLSTVTLDAFFSSLGNPSTFDPKVFYDPYNNRWTVVACGNAASASSSVLIAVSQTSNPTGSWNMYALDVDAGNTTWFDYPSIGFNKDWIVVGGNMFTNSSFSYTGGKIYVCKKSDFYAGIGSPGITTINPGLNGFSVCPAVTYDNSISTLYLTQNYNGNSGGNGFIGLYAITGAVGSEVLSAVTLTSTPNPWASGAPVTNFAPQLGTANKVACNDSRMQKTIYRNGNIWCTHTVFLPAASATRSAVQWWQLSTGAAVLQRGRIDDASGTNFYAFPSIDVNKNNDAMIGCAKFNSGIFPSACYALRMAADPVNTFQTDFVYKAGQASYFKTFGGSSNRWGDYTSVCVDPTNDMNFWTVQEYSRPPSGGFDLWGTWWAGICTPPPTPGAISGVSPANAGATNQNFSVAAVSGATSYTWTFPAGCVITAGAATNSVTVTLGNTSGTVSVIANNGSCSSGSKTFNLTINSTPLTATATNNGPRCPNDTLKLSASGSGGTPPYNYSWTGPNSFSSTLQNPSITNVTASNAGTYTVVVSDNAVPPASVSRVTNVVVNPTPTASIIPAGPLTVCSSNTPVTLTAVTNATSPTYLWKAAGVPISPAQTNSTLLASTTNIYSVMVTSNGCKATSAPVSLTVKQSSTSTFDTSVCKMYKWNGVNYNQSGTYTFSTINSVGCDSIATLHLRVSKITSTFTKTDARCYGTLTGSITVTPSGGIAPYRYKLGSAGAYQTSGTFNNLRAGTYSVYIIDSIGCTAIASSIVVGQPVAVTSTFTKTDVTCYGTATGSITVTASNGVAPYTYRLGTTGSYQPSNTFMNVKAGAYKVYILDANGCAAITATITITQPLAVSATYTATSATCYGTATGSLTVNGINGVPPYMYKFGSTGIYGNNNTFSNIKGGTYFVYIKDANGCIGSIKPVVGQPAAIVLTYTKVDVSCTATNSGSITLIKSGGPSHPPYGYKLGSTLIYGPNNTFTGLRAGNYVGYIKDSLGCIANVSIPLPAPTGCFTVTTTAKADKLINENSQSLKITLLPNPSSNRFTLIAHSNSKKPVTVRVTDAEGRSVLEMKGIAGQPFSFGENLINGLYLVEVRQGTELKTVKAIKEQ